MSSDFQQVQRANVLLNSSKFDSRITFKTHHHSNINYRRLAMLNDRLKEIIFKSDNILLFSSAIKNGFIDGRQLAMSCEMVF